ncbi:MAG: hypothetical protein KAI40_06635 [Desulfobacterales bacterium]|nr:hypothetical protein [Desulfobacterales bacterium]
MEKICLVKAGKFLLGLDTSHIISTLNLNDLKAGEISETDSFFLLLESFLSQKHLDISGSKVIVLKNKTNSKHLTLLVDKTLEEIDLPQRLEPYPMLYPELAKKCCPKVFIYNDQVVLLLDPKQLSITHKKLKTEHGLITLNDLMSIAEKVEQEDILQSDSSDTSDTKSETPKSKPETKIDDQAINTLVSWTFDKFNKFDSNEEIIISVDELPPGLIQQEGLSKESLQQLIDKIILQCEKTKYRTMKNTIKEKLNGIKF